MSEVTFLRTKVALRRGREGWERWDRNVDEWIPLPDHLAEVPEHAAREFIARFYSVLPRQVALAQI